MRETVHASCVSIGGRGVLIAGASGSGKSDLALRLIDRGAQLVADDYCEVTEDSGRLRAGPPASIAGMIEVRGVGLLEMPHEPDAVLCLLVDLDDAPERMPEQPGSRSIAGQLLPALALAALEPSAPIKVEQALLRFGLPIA